ncbi:hypothetical protein FSP39_012125 [Pinctada imbricata]|uniref:DED domain-containing protein n=1 Tax=Pinctada imbricata TaxID=66713 RepID=A0AA88Y0L1_PINIB|nr:hypothetical protein FSP39_012125 [Pinctada imbricata]
MPAFEINIPNCSDNFGKVLVQISRQINTEELSNLKLMTMANKKIRLQDFDRLKNPGDFLSLLYRRNYYHEKDTSFLEMILEEVGRKDLSKILFRHMMEYGGGDVRLEKDGDSTEHTESPSSSLEGQMSVDGSLDRDDLYDRDEEPMQSSQNSISDDEKLQLLQELA